jgi:hypothetical protein
MIFAPERWGTLEKFQKFHHNTYTFNKNDFHALQGASNNLHKALTLYRVAKQHIITLEEDNEQLKKTGISSGIRGQELSALIESTIIALYSSLDCARMVVTGIYKNHRGVKQSTRKFFQSCYHGSIALTVPAEIRSAFKDASWYYDFMKLRDTLIHSDVGSCHQDGENKKIIYFLPALGTNTRVKVIDDIFEYIDKLIRQINSLLNDTEIKQYCGIFNKRFYWRLVKPNEAIDFNSGRCDAHKWFDTTEISKCPFISTCGAYTRKTDN